MKANTLLKKVNLTDSIWYSAIKHSWLTCQIFLKSGEAEFIKVFFPHPYQIQVSHTHIFPSFSAVTSSVTVADIVLRALSPLCTDQPKVCHIYTPTITSAGPPSYPVVLKIMIMSQFCTNFSTFIISKLAIHILPFTVKFGWCLSCYSLHVQDFTARLQDLLKNFLTILNSSFITLLLSSGHFTFPLYF